MSTVEEKVGRRGGARMEGSLFLLAVEVNTGVRAEYAGTELCNLSPARSILVKQGPGHYALLKLLGKQPVSRTAPGHGFFLTVL